MSGSIQNAASTTVLPQNLRRAFAHSREYRVLENEYKNGESQRSDEPRNADELRKDDLILASGPWPEHVEED
jgi:hypothetical protein